MASTPPHPERRGASRRSVRLDVTVDGTDSVTRNVSRSGVLLELPDEAPVGSELTMDMAIPKELGGTGERVRFYAEVVRVEDRPKGRAIAAHFLGWELVG
ncbi:MAG: PilZ domain-containing protein [Longimicrobiales bacterium]|nr:PilZ domain-containing protein [Longimicrobiales bacterium]